MRPIMEENVRIKSHFNQNLDLLWLLALVLNLAHVMFEAKG